MESKGRRTEVQIETHEIKVVRLRKAHAFVLCERCGEIVTTLNPENPTKVTNDQVLNQEKINGKHN